MNKIDKFNLRLMDLIFAFLALAGCGGGVLLVDTLPPSAEIYLRSKATEDFQLIGKAPYKLTTTELRSKYNVDGAFALETRLTGYNPQLVFVSEVIPSTEMNLFLNMKTLEEQKAEGEGSGTGNPEVLNRTLDQLFESQRLVKVGRYDDALVALNRLQQENPNMAAVFEMQGGVYYIKKDYVKALDSYEKALRLNPKNLELLSMKRYLEKYVKKEGSAN